MKVKQLIKELQEKCHPETEVILTVGDEHEDIFSSSELELHGDGEDYVEIYMDKNAVQQQ